MSVAIWLGSAPFRDFLKKKGSKRRLTIYSTHTLRSTTVLVRVWCTSEGGTDSAPKPFCESDLVL